MLAHGLVSALDRKKVQASDSAVGVRKEIALCGRCWCKPLMGCVARTRISENAIVERSKRRGSKRAALAVGHDILVIYYHMVKTGQEYQEKGEEFFHQRDRGKVERQLVQRLERMGYQVTRQPPPAA